MRNQWYSQSVIAVDQSEQNAETRRGYFRSSKSSSRRSTMVVYMLSKILQLTVGSRDLSLAEKRILFLTRLT